MQNCKPALIVINQTVNPAFNGWLAGLAAQVGSVELWSGNAPANMPPGVLVRRAPAYDRSSAAARLRTWLLFTARVAAALVGRGGSTPLFVVTNPPFAPLLAWLLYRWQGRPFGLLEWDIYPDILKPMGYARPDEKLYRAWRRWHGRALQAARPVITLGDYLAGALKNIGGDPDLPVTVIPNWVDTDWIRPRRRVDNPFALEQGLEDRLVVLYSGNLGATHAIETLVAVAERLRQAKDIRFLVIGEGSKQPLVQQAIQSGRTPTLTWLPLQPAEQLPLTLASADIGVVTLADGYQGLSMPSKTYALMAAGNAILGISRAPNDLSATIAGYGCGANFEPEAVEAIAASIQALAADRPQLDRLRCRAREAAVENFSATRCEIQLTEAVHQHLLGQLPTCEAGYLAG